MYCTQAYWAYIGWLGKLAVFRKKCLPMSIVYRQRRELCTWPKLQATDKQYCILSLAMNQRSQKTPGSPRLYRTFFFLVSCSGSVDSCLASSV